MSVWSDNKHMLSPHRDILIASSARQIVIEPLNCSDSVAYVSTLRRQTKSCDSICLVLVAKEIHCTYCRILNICQCDGSILIDFGISFQQQICQ